MKKFLFLILLIPALAFPQKGYRGWGGVSLGNMLAIISDSTVWHKKGSTPDTILVDGGLPIRVTGLKVTGTTKLDGTLSMNTIATEQVKLGTGSDAAPELSSMGDANTGVRIPGSDVVTVVTGSAEQFRVTADSVRNENTLRQKGIAQFGATATMATIATNGKITSPDTLVSTLGIRTEGTALVKGKLTVNDSLVTLLGSRNEGGARIKGASIFGATTTPLYITTLGRIGNTTAPQHTFVGVGNTAALSGFNFVNPNRNKARSDTTASTDTSSVYGGIRGGYPTIGVRSNFGLLEFQVQNGWGQFGVKLTVADSFRTNLTSKLIGDVQVGTGSAWYAAEDSLVVTSGATQNVRTRSMIDTGEYQLPAGVEGFGKVKIGAEYADFWFESDGTVTLVTNTTNVSTTNDADGKLNIYDNGSNIVIENQLGSTLKCLIHITYMTP